MNKDISIMIDDDVKFNYRVGAIFEYNGKVIVEKSEEAGHSVLPGGRVKALEDTKTALIREMQEEMHWDISEKAMKLQHIVENFFDAKGIKCQELYFIYKIMLDDSDEIVHREKEEFTNYDSESSYYEWVKKDEIDKEYILPVALKRIINEKNFGTTVVKDM